MKKTAIHLLSIIILLAILNHCDTPSQSNKDKNNKAQELTPMQKKVKQYATVPLTADISHLNSGEKQMLGLLFKAAELMDNIFWMQNIGNKDEFLSSITDQDLKKFAMINYGPWDEMDNLNPFIEGYGNKPAGAEFYPHDITKEEFEAFKDPLKTSLYTIIRRNDKGELYTVWYHEAFQSQVMQAAELLRKASALSEDKDFAHYLDLRAEALLTDNYQPSDFAWLDVKNNNVDVVIGPIENYTDQLFGYKAAQESYVLIKDREWSSKLAKYAAFLPQLQKELPVDPVYKQETPGSDADLNAYDVVYYAGDCNMAGKTIAINLPNDEEVQLKKGTRKLQLKNAMKAKFDSILVPIARQLVPEDQQGKIKFGAFFANTMFHEVAHGLGIKNTLNGKGTVRSVLKEQYSPVEECKADILGLFLVTKLQEKGEYTDTELLDNYVTFMAGIFRSVRFGAASAHGKANMITFSYFSENGAFTRSAEGKYLVNFEKMKEATANLAQLILKIQGDGDYEGARRLIEQRGVVNPGLQSELDKIAELGIPIDIAFEQGPQMLGL
ncbi:MAG: Zn-dependent hydrolase [Bacteroidetes bacterium]|nr:Zn-dependent hydrolase [Bacteroidota bacterium]